MNHTAYQSQRAALLARALLARIGELPINTARRAEAREHFERAEAWGERWFRAVCAIRSLVPSRRPVTPRRQRA